MAFLLISIHYYIMKIVFVSSCGIPNNYGGFEQFAGISQCDI